MHLIQPGQIAEKPGDAGFLKRLPRFAIIHQLRHVSDQPLSTETHDADHVAGFSRRGGCHQVRQIVNATESGQVRVWKTTPQHEVCERIVQAAASFAGPTLLDQNGTGGVSNGTAQSVGGPGIFFVSETFKGAAQVKLRAMQVAMMGGHV